MDITNEHKKLSWVMVAHIRLFVDTNLHPRQRLSLSSEQSHYLTRVMRMGVGDLVEVFNGVDGAFEAHIEIIERRQVYIIVDALRARPVEGFDLSLCFAIVKRTPLEVIVQKATELGVSRLIPVITDRTTAKAFNADRLKHITIEAAEQCERITIPQLFEPVALTTYLETLPSPILYADEYGNNEEMRWGGDQGRAPAILTVLAQFERLSPVTILTGPEGGFSPEERALLRDRSDVYPFSLGPRILRADTAAVAALTLVQARLGDWG